MTFTFDDEVFSLPARPHVDGLASEQASPPIPIHGALIAGPLAGRGVSPTVTRTAGRRELILPELDRGGCNRHGSFYHGDA
jgi:hypothetical protein